MTNKPLATLRDGALKATIWRNDGKKGDFCTARITRTYRTADAQYRDTDCFSRNELLKVAHLAMRAYEELARLHQADSSTRPATADDGRVA